MPGKASERLKLLNTKIMNTWEKRAIDEVAAALPQNSLVLRDSLPEFLDEIAKALDTEVDLAKLRVKRHRAKSSGLGKKHGNDRAHEANYTIDQLIFEYSILRQVVCEVMEEQEPLSATEREVIVCAIEQAANDAATEFSGIFSDIQEKTTYTLAHDLRGPISAAKMGAQLIIKKPDDAVACAKIAGRIVSSMDRIDQMIHDLLDGSRLRAGEELSLVLKDCDLDTVLNQVADDVRIQNPNRVSYHSVGPVTGHWDEGGLRRVVDNLMSNALKFSPPESCVTMSLRKMASTVEVSVHNSGKPIAPEEKSALFQKFRRARNAEGKSGWGLGLTVVKGITEAHGGSVGVESSAEKGTIFKVILPLTTANAHTDDRRAHL